MHDNDIMSKSNEKIDRAFNIDSTSLGRFVVLDVMTIAKSVVHKHVEKEGGK